MTIAVTCPCGGRFAAQPHLAGKTVRCPQCQQTLYVPEPAREPLAPIVNPFSDDAPVQAELVPPVAQTPPTYPSSHDPFGGKATVNGPAVGRPQPNFVTPQPTGPSQSTGQPQPIGQSQPAEYAQVFDKPAGKSYLGYYIFGAVLFGFVGFVIVAGIASYQFIQQIKGMNFEEAQPMVVQSEDYAAARAQFKTSLTFQEGAPQDWEPLVTPQGAVDLDYQSDGHTLRAFVDPPPVDGQPRPGVVFLHNGFAWGDGDWEMSQPFRDAGFVVMSPVLRGENGQPGYFSLYFNEVDDVLAATSAFAALPYVDKNQLYIAGPSSGGTLATLTAMTSDQFLAMASYSGTMNMESVRAWQPELLVFDQSNQRETLMRSPEAFATSFKCPAKLFYGSSEPWFAQQTIRTVASARSAGLDVQSMVVPGDHMSSVHPAILRTIEFFRQFGTTNGYPPAAPPNLTLRAAPPENSPPEFSIPEPSTPLQLTPPDPVTPPTPVTPPIPVPTIPVPSSPDFGIGGPPAGPRRGPSNVPFPGRPNFPTRPGGPISNLLHQGVVTFEVLEYSERRPQRISVITALTRQRWADVGRIEIDEAAGVIRVPARKRQEVDTAAAKVALEEAGFTIGNATFTASNEENNP